MLPDSVALVCLFVGDLITLTLLLVGVGGCGTDSVGAVGAYFARGLVFCCALNFLKSANFMP